MPREPAVHPALAWCTFAALASGARAGCCAFGGDCGTKCYANGQEIDGYCHTSKFNCERQCGGGAWMADSERVDNCNAEPPLPACPAMPSGVPAQAPDVDNRGYASAHGKLRLDGVHLVDAHGFRVQLMGASSHGVQWFWRCNTRASLRHLVERWGINVYRVAVYIDVSQEGYVKNRWIKDDLIAIASWCKELGIYTIVDWHVRTPGDPNYWLDGPGVGSGIAIDFWVEIATLFKNETHVLYEIASTPNPHNAPGADTWATIKAYHDAVIPAIRAIDNETVIIAGTPNYSQKIHEAAANPVALPHNVMYSFQFYAGDHLYLLDRLRTYAPQIPIFVSEWAVSNFDGGVDGNVYLDNAMAFLDLAKNVSGATGVLLSWTHWSYSDGSPHKSSSMLKPGSCEAALWDNTHCAGNFIKTYIKANVGTAADIATQTSTTTSSTTTDKNQTSTLTTTSTTCVGAWRQNRDLALAWVCTDPETQQPISAALLPSWPRLAQFAAVLLAVHRAWQ